MRAEQGATYQWPIDRPDDYRKQSTKRRRPLLRRRIEENNMRLSKGRSSRKNRQTNPPSIDHTKNPQSFAKRLILFRKKRRSHQQRTYLSDIRQQPSWSTRVRALNQTVQTRIHPQAETTLFRNQNPMFRCLIYPPPPYWFQHGPMYPPIYTGHRGCMLTLRTFNNKNKKNKPSKIRLRQINHKLLHFSIKSNTTRTKRNLKVKSPIKTKKNPLRTASDIPAY